MGTLLLIIREYYEQSYTNKLHNLDEIVQIPRNYKTYLYCHEEIETQLLETKSRIKNLLGQRKNP